MVYYESGTGVKKEAVAEWFIQEGVVGGPETNFYYSRKAFLQVSTPGTGTCQITDGASSQCGKD